MTNIDYDCRKLTEKVRKSINSFGKDISDPEVLDIIEDYVLQDPVFEFDNYKFKIKIIDDVFNSIRKDLAILDPYARDPGISEIMVNGKNNIFIERHGTVEKVDTSFQTTEELEEVIRRIGAKVHREINEMNPILDARLEDGSRVNAVNKNVALGGPILTIRKFPEQAIDMEKLIYYGTVTCEAAEFLKKLVQAGYNIFISGGTSSGKTTFLNVLSDYIPKSERVIVIEDSAELQIKGVENLIRMECRNANIQGKGQVDMRQLIKTSLRMRPNRIIVGEVRGEEVLDMIQAMNTGHDGSLSTGHGNSPEGMLNRLETMFLQAANFPIEAIRGQIAEGIDIIVHLGRRRDNKRIVTEIVEISGLKDSKIVMNKLFKYDLNDGLIRTGNELINKEKLEIKGLKI
ncbi:MAG: CpaF family protein [Peptostreptococcaceae bacterium]|nr:CpaF family protein [Peptostreptococcaceae bacterium]